jgi:hypothetical protein
MERAIAHCEQYQQCRALHDEKKWEECTKVGLRNMADCTMPHYLHIKTLIMMVVQSETVGTRPRYVTIVIIRQKI